VFDRSDSTVRTVAVVWVVLAVAAGLLAWRTDDLDAESVADTRCG